MLDYFGPLNDSHDFRSLSREHIQVVVECGCPSLFRKAVNSAKRLRATLGLDEGDVGSLTHLVLLYNDDWNTAITMNLLFVHSIV